MSARMRVLLGAAILTIGPILPARVSAAPIADFNFVETALAGGNYQYDHTLFNQGDPVVDAGYDIFDVAIFFTSGAFISASVPMDWDVIGGPGFVAAFSLAPGIPPAGVDVGPGMTLGGFSFVFDQQIGLFPLRRSSPTLSTRLTRFSSKGSQVQTFPSQPHSCCSDRESELLFAARRRSTGHLLRPQR